jgi:hypothetical protein
LLLKLCRSFCHSFIEKLFHLLRSAMCQLALLTAKLSLLLPELSLLLSQGAHLFAQL